MRNKGVRILISSFCIVSKTIICWCQQPSNWVWQFGGSGAFFLILKQGNGYCKGKHQTQDVFSIESKENRCEV